MMIKTERDTVYKYIAIVLTVLTVTVTGAGASVVVVPVHNTIDGGLAAFIDRSIEEAILQGADAVIFDIDTPGGRIDSAVHIKDAILKANITTIAFVDMSAISAGALISIACDSLFMSTGSSIGAATAVDLEGKKASEKVISYFRGQMRATAEAKNRRADIAAAMVDEELVVEGISKQGMLLTLTYTEALDAGFADGLFENVEDIVAHLDYSDPSIEHSRLNWAEYIVRFLTHPVISSLLMSLGFLGLLIEIRTPGWGIGGTIGLIALALFFGSHYIVNLASLGELLIFSVGIILLTLEVFVIPGFGIAGVSGIVLIFLSLYLSLVGKMPEANDFMSAALTMGGAFLLAVAGGAVIIKILPKTALFNKLTLGMVESADIGFESAERKTELIGTTGITLSDLRPAGKIFVDGSRIDVVTQGEYIKKDTEVIVIEAHGARVVVKEK